MCQLRSSTRQITKRTCGIGRRSAANVHDPSASHAPIHGPARASKRSAFGARVCLPPSARALTAGESAPTGLMTMLVMHGALPLRRLAAPWDAADVRFPARLYHQ
jgi:hypothetical protein